MNKKYSAQLIILMVCTILGSCNKSIEKHPVVTVNLSDIGDFEDGEDLKLSEIAQSVSYLKLQTNDSCLIDHIRRIKFYNHCYYVQNAQKEVVVFDTTGKFIRKFGIKGKGPGEIIQLDDFAILEKDSILLLYDAMNPYVHYFKISGEYLRQYSIKFSPFSVEEMNNDLIAFVNVRDAYKYSNNYSISLFDKNMVLKNQLISKSWEVPFNKQKMALHYAKLYKFKDTLSYWEFYYDTVWRVTPEKAIPKYCFQVGKDKLPYEVRSDKIKFRKEWDRYSQIERIFETKNFFFIELGKKRELIYSLYNKQTNTIRNVKALINDIDGIGEFWPDKNGNLSDSVIYSTFYPYDLKKLILKKEVFIDYKNPKSKAILDMANNSKLEDNPVVIFVNIK